MDPEQLPNYFNSIITNWTQLKDIDSTHVKHIKMYLIKNKLRLVEEGKRLNLIFCRLNRTYIYRLCCVSRQEYIKNVILDSLRIE